jgi:hypothetical protein
VADAANPNLDHQFDNALAWQGAVFELLSPVQQMGLTSQSAIMIRKKPRNLPFTNSFDHALRQGLMTYGLSVSPTDNPDLTLVYDMAPLTNPDIRKKAAAKLGEEKATGSLKDSYFLTLDYVARDGKILKSTETLAVLPYELREYKRPPGLAVLPKDGQALDLKPVYETRH